MLGFAMLALLWSSELLCLARSRCPLTARFSPRFAFLRHLLLAIYVFSFPAGFCYLACCACALACGVTSLLLARLDTVLAGRRGGGRGGAGGASDRGQLWLAVRLVGANPAASLAEALQALASHV